MLITPEYRALLDKYRTEAPRWGNGGGRHVRTIADLILHNKKYDVRTVVDYGCGQGQILDFLVKEKLVHPDKVQGYDPCVVGREAPPRPADLLVCTDMLEHVERECLDEVLKHIASLHRVVAYIQIHTKHSKAILPDGRNAHILQRPPVWWQAKLDTVYKDARLINSPDDSNIRPVWICQ